MCIRIHWWFCRKSDILFIKQIARKGSTHASPVGCPFSPYNTYVVQLLIMYNIKVVMEVRQT